MQRIVMPEVVVAFAAFVVGVVAAVFWRRVRSLIPSPSPAPPLASVNASGPTQRLQQLSDPITNLAESSAHPRDLLENASFREAVAIFESDQLSLKLVTDYAGGANWPLATAACAALNARADRAEALPAVLSSFRHCRPWPMYYVLRYFETLEQRPPMGALILQAAEWWIDHPFIPGLLGEYFSARAEKGDEPSFGDGLGRAAATDITNAESLLRKIDNAVSRQLLEALATFRRTTLDRDYLQTFGRFVEDDPDRPLLVEHDAIRDLLARAEVCIQQRPPRSLLVVGEPRSGKTSFVTLLAMRAQARCERRPMAGRSSKQEERTCRPGRPTSANSRSGCAGCRSTWRRTSGCCGTRPISCTWRRAACTKVRARACSTRCFRQLPPAGSCC